MCVCLSKLIVLSTAKGTGLAFRRTAMCDCVRACVYARVHVPTSGSGSQVVDLCVQQEGQVCTQYLYYHEYQI